MEREKFLSAEQATELQCDGYEFEDDDHAGIAQLVEHQPSKLRVAGSNPVSRSNR